MGSNKLYNSFFIVLFSSILLIPFLRSFSNVDESTAWMEKREVSEFPKFAINKLKSFPQSINTYFNDHLGFRKYIILAHAYLKNDILNVSSNPHKVIFGKNGWLFLNTDKICEDYFMNVRPFTQTQLNTITNDLNQRKEFLEKRNIDYYLFGLPGKHVIYPEHLPDNICQYDTISRFEQVKSTLSDKYKFEIFGLHDTMISTKNEYDYYFDKDTHWNLNGAAFGYSLVMDKLIEKYPYLNAFDCMNWNKVYGVFKNQGDLSLQMGRWDYNIGNHVVNVPPKNISVSSREIEVGELPETDKFLGPPRRFKSDQPNSLKVLFLRDSYTNLNMQYFAASFSETVFVWTHQFTPKIIEKEKPDIVIELMAERFLSELD